MTGPSLILRPATLQEIDHIHELNSAAWAGDLTVQQYHAREHTLSSQPLTRKGGLRNWVLVDPNDEKQQILSSSETIRKAALVATPSADGEAHSSVEQVVAHGIGSVFTPPKQRGHGYAKTMLTLLAETLKKENGSGFSVLYSDIGKVFYASVGWIPHRSSHLELPPKLDADISGVKLLTASDVPNLCTKDIAAIRASLEKPHLKPRIAFVPDYQTFEWHWAREEFVSRHLRKNLGIKPEIKGAMTADGKRWVLWTRTFGKQSSELNILRLVNLSDGTDQALEEENIAKLLTAAAREAAKWELQMVYMWNPDEISVRAGRRVAGDQVKLEDREEESISSLMMHEHSSGPADVDWEANEKFGWC